MTWITSFEPKTQAWWYSRTSPVSQRRGLWIALPRMRQLSLEIILSRIGFQITIQHFQLSLNEQFWSHLACSSTPGLPIRGNSYLFFWYVESIRFLFVWIFAFFSGVFHCWFLFLSSFVPNNFSVTIFQFLAYDLGLCGSVHAPDRFLNCQSLNLQLLML